MKRIICALMTVFVLLFLFGCAERRTAEDIFTSFSIEYKMPTGKAYFSSREDGEDGYFSEWMKMNLYSRYDGTSELPRANSYALFIGERLDVFFEIGIFVCTTDEDAEEICKMIQRRIDTVLSYRKDETCVTIPKKENTGIYVSDNTCVYYITEDSAKVKNMISGII